MKIYKKTEAITVYGSNRPIALEYRVSKLERRSAKEDEREPEPEASFRFCGSRYYLSEFMRIEDHAPEWMKEFDGYQSDTSVSSVLIKLSRDGETVKAFILIAIGYLLSLERRNEAPIAK